MKVPNFYHDFNMKITPTDQADRSCFTEDNNIGEKGRDVNHSYHFMYFVKLCVSRICAIKKLAKIFLKIFLVDLFFKKTMLFLFTLSYRPSFCLYSEFTYSYIFSTKLAFFSSLNLKTSIILLYLRILLSYNCIV